MSKKKLFPFAIICIVILAASLAVYFQLTRNQETSWLAVNDFVVYQQDFVWANGSSVTYMFWNVTGLTSNTAEIQLSSHGAQVSNGRVSNPGTEMNLEVNIASRKVIDSSIPSNELPVGSEFPFWIPQSVKVGDFVQTSYGDSTISPSQTLNILGQDRNCWLVAYAFGAGNNMDRYYDTTTGICLQIRTHIFSNGLSISVNETAVKTNIKSI